MAALRCCGKDDSDKMTVESCIVERLEALERKKKEFVEVYPIHGQDPPSKDHAELEDALRIYATQDDLTKDHADLEKFVQSVQKDLQGEVRKLKEQWEAIRPAPVAENTDLEKAVDDLAPEIAADMKGGVKPRSSVLQGMLNGLQNIDRFGIPQRPQKSIGGGCTVVFFFTIFIYTLIMYIQYQSRPLIQHSDVKWSNSAGPYPFPVTCFSERCWVSMTFDDAASGQAGGCVKHIPADQRGKCFELKETQTIKFNMCFSQLPGQGVRMQYGGAPKWGEKASSLGITNATSRNYGLASISDMEGMTPKMPRMDWLTPLREGVVSAMYVRTDNKSQPVTSAGRVRHEWFSLSLNSVTADSDFATDPCNAQMQAWEGATKKKREGRTMIVMQPNYQHIRVVEPERWETFLFGSVGGAVAMADVAFLWLLSMFYKFQSRRANWKSSE